MVNKCGAVNCRGNYDKEAKCRLFTLPPDTLEQQRMKDGLMPFHLVKTLSSIPKNIVFVKDTGNLAIHLKEKERKHDQLIPRPSLTSLNRAFHRSPKPAPRKTNKEDRQLAIFKKKDEIKDFTRFHPESALKQKYKNLIISREENQLICVFMKSDCSESDVTVIVDCKKTLTCDLTLTAFKQGIRVPLGKILNPNNGLNSNSQFLEAVHRAVNFQPDCDSLTLKVLNILRPHLSSPDSECCKSNKNTSKLEFLTHQLELIVHKHYSVDDYCFAIESYPHCNYDILSFCGRLARIQVCRGAQV